MLTVKSLHSIKHRRLSCNIMHVNNNIKMIHDGSVIKVFKQSIRQFSSEPNQNPSLDGVQNKYLRLILENNLKWVTNLTDKDPEYFKTLSQLQNPKILYFGCSDSRVAANNLLGLG